MLLLLDRATKFYFGQFVPISFVRCCCLARCVRRRIDGPLDSVPNSISRRVANWVQRKYKLLLFDHNLNVCFMLLMFSRSFTKRSFKRLILPMQPSITDVLSEFPSNAKKIKTDLRRAVFKDCTFRFSWIFPWDSVTEESWEPHTALLYRLLHNTALSVATNSSHLLNARQQRKIAIPGFLGTLHSVSVDYGWKNMRQAAFLRQWLARPTIWSRF